MKKAVLIISSFIYFLALESCSKDDLPSLRTKLVGSWELREIYGSQVAGASPYFAPGNGDIWKFSDATYQKYSNRQLVNSGTYTLTKIGAVSSEIPEEALILDTGIISSTIHFSIIKNTLTMYNGIVAADGYIAKYVRQ